MTGRVIVLRGDAAHLPLPDASIHAVVCDPPYALAELPVAKVAEALSAWLGGDRGYVPKTGAGGFMGRKWDDFVPPPAAWDECMRVLKPGGHVLAFAAPRTQDLMGMSIRLAGFEIRDGMKWIFGSGFPKSLDVSKAIDKRRDDRDPAHAVGAWLRRQRVTAGLTAKAVAENFRTAPERINHGGCVANWEGGSVPTWEQWQQLRLLIGFGGEMDAEVWRLNGRKGRPGEAWADREVVGSGHRIRRESTVQIVGLSDGEYDITSPATDEAARWEGWGTALKPAHEPIVMARKPLAGTVATNILKHGTGALNIADCRVSGEGSASDVIGRWPSNVLLSEDAATELDRQSGASRFFPAFRYEAKADAASRPCLPDGTAWVTVKPVPLMRWLVRLVTPPGGTVLDPFCGTGPTGEAAIIEGFDAILLDKDPQAIALTRVRLAKPIQPLMFAPEPAAGQARPKLPASAQDSLFDLGEAS